MLSISLGYIAETRSRGGAELMMWTAPAARFRVVEERSILDRTPEITSDEPDCQDWTRYRKAVVSDSRVDESGREVLNRNSRDKASRLSDRPPPTWRRGHAHHLIIGTVRLVAWATG